MSNVAKELEETTQNETYVNVGYEMLSAAHTLLSSDRLTDEKDLLISTFLEALTQGPLGLEEITKACNEIWPGADISKNAVRTALTDASSLDLVAECIDANGDGTLWTLGRQGNREISTTQDWLRDATLRLAHEISDRARDDFGELDEPTAINWAKLIRKLFSDEIARSAIAYSGRVELGVSGSVRPMVLSGKTILNAIDAQEALPETSKDFLKACVLSAVDETDPFGNELLGQVSTSCVLHAIAARRGRANAQEVMGGLRGTRVVIDTPILVSFLAGTREADRFSELVTQAIEQEVQVVVPEHVLEELNEVVDRVEAQHLEGLTHALKSEQSAYTYAQMVDEQMLEVFLSGVKTKQYRTWNDFRTRTRSLAEELSILGIQVRPHGNSAPNVRENVDWLELKLREQFSDAARGRGRGDAQISRDAESMEMVWRARRSAANNGNNSALWPGGWLLSYDSKIGPAYRQANPSDREPLVLTPAQFLTLLTESAPAAKIPELVAAAASFMRQESMLKIATKYPPAVALTLAQTLTQESTSKTDVRVAQFASLGALLEQYSDEHAAGAILSSEIGARRMDRLAAASKAQISMVDAERSRVEQTLTKTGAVVSHEQDLRKVAEAERDTARNELQDLKRKSASDQARAQRRQSVLVLTVIILAVAIILAILHLWGFAVAAALSAAILFATGKTWIDDADAGIGKMFWAVAPVVIGISDILTWLKG